VAGSPLPTFEFSDIRVRWNLDRDLPKYTPRFNIAPETSPNILVIIRQKGVNERRLMQWGLIPHWATELSIGSRMINGPFTTGCPLFSNRKTKNNGLMLLEHLSPKPDAHDVSPVVNSAKYDGR